MSKESSTPICDLNSNNDDINNIIDNINIDNKEIQKEIQKENTITNSNSNEIKPNVPDENIETEEISYFDIIFYELLPSIISIILFFILSLENVDDILGNYLKFMLNDESRLTYLGILFKSILFGIIFYIINKFII